MFNAFLPGYAINSLIYVISGIQHHGIVGAQLNGMTQSVHACDKIFQGLLLLVFNMKIGPGAEANQKDKPNPKDQSEA